MKFIELTKDYSEAWDAVVYSSDDAWLHHLYNLLKLTEKVWSYESKSFLMENDGKIVGIFPLQMDRHTKKLCSTFMGSGGHAVKNGLPSEIHRYVLMEMYKHVEELAHENGSPEIGISIPPLSISSMNNQKGVNPLIHFMYEDISTQTWIANLTPPEDVLLSSLSYDARRNIRNAKRERFAVEPIKLKNEVEECYKIHNETFTRTGADPYPKEYLIGMFVNIHEAGHGTILKATDKNGEIAGFITIGLFKKTAIYWVGASRTNQLDSGINYLMQFQAMLWAKGRGAEWFENGEAFPNLRDGKQKGMSVFKGKFGGELYRYYKGRLAIEHDGGRKSILKSWARQTKSYALDSAGLFQKVVKGKNISLRQE